jgi:hypothetical protein
MRAGFLFGPRHRLVATYAGYCQTAFLSCAFGAVGYWSGLHGVGLVSLVVALFPNLFAVARSLLRGFALIVAVTMVNRISLIPLCGEPR